MPHDHPHLLDRHQHHHGHHHHHPVLGPVGHNGARPVAAQWQTPHLPADREQAPADPRHKDLDLVETAFVEGFGRAPDPASFLRLAGIPFVGEDATGRRLHLLRTEIEDVVDVGTVSPLLGGGALYDPLPARMTSRRRRLAFVYHDGTGVDRLGFDDARALRDVSGPSHLPYGPTGGTSNKE